MTPTLFGIFPGLGYGEIVVIGFIALLIFGNRLPSVMRSLGKSVTEFKKGVSGVEEEIDQALTAEPKKSPQPQPEPQPHDGNTA